MSKKKKIIISVVFVVILLGSIITAIILANLKHYNMKYQSEYHFNDHTKMVQISLDSKYYPMNGFNAKGVNKIRTIDNKYGLYSYVKNQMIIEPIYSSIETLNNNTLTEKCYFKLNSTDALNKIQVVDENGQDIGIFTYNADKKVSSCEIKKRTIEYVEKNNTVQTKINNQFKNESVEIRAVSFLETPYYNDEYSYELWKLTTTDDVVYTNLYKVTDKGHELIQTTNIETGIELEQTKLDVEFLVNGTPVFVNIKDHSFKGEISSREIQIYDVNFNLKGTATVSTELEQYEIAEFRVGNNIIFQYRIPATDNKYTYSETDSLGETKYYSIETYKLSLKNGSYNQITFDYVINSYHDTFNTETVLINATKIEDKKLDVARNYLINERLQFKEIDYEFNYITKINDNRYITSLNNRSNFNLIDKNYNLISHFENCLTVLATDNSIIANSDGYYYVCNTDGVIIKKYATQNITYVRDDKYYIKKVEKVANNETTYEYYLEQLGQTQSQPLYTYSSTNKYTFNNQNYDSIKLTNEKEVTLLTTIKKVDTTYTYQVYTIDGKLLTTLSNQAESVFQPEVLYADDNNVIVYINDTYYVLDR